MCPSHNVGLCHPLTSGRLDVVDGVAVEPHLGRGVGLFLLVAADGEGVLRDLHEDEVPLLPLLPNRLAHGVEVTAVLHVHGLVHPHSNFKLKLFVLGIFRYRQLFPLRGLEVDTVASKDLTRESSR